MPKREVGAAEAMVGAMAEATPCVAAADMVAAMPFVAGAADIIVVAPPSAVEAGITAVAMRCAVADVAVATSCAVAAAECTSGAGIMAARALAGGRRVRGPTPDAHSGWGARMRNAQRILDASSAMRFAVVRSMAVGRDPSIARHLRAAMHPASPDGR